MRVRIQLLGTYRRFLPAGSQDAAYELEVPAGTLLEALLAQLPLPAEGSRVVLVNGRTPQAGQSLAESDTITLFPAAAGG